MTEQSRLEEALSRFDSALTRFEAASVRSRSTARRSSGLEDEAAALREDRARMAEELDELRAHNHALADINAKAARKVDGIMERLRSVVDESQA